MKIVNEIYLHTRRVTHNFVIRCKIKHFLLHIYYNYKKNPHNDLRAFIYNQYNRLLIFFIIKNISTCLHVKKIMSTCLHVKNTCLHVKKTCLHVFMSKNVSSCLHVKKNVSSCLHVKKRVFMSSCQKTCLHVFMSKKRVFMSSCLKNVSSCLHV